MAPVNNFDYPSQFGDEKYENELDSMLYSRHTEIESLNDLTEQRGTPIPALFNQFYKFIQNPSAISVETFKRMVDTDDTIGSGVDLLVTCLVARVGAFQHENKEVAQWVNNWLEGLEGGGYREVMKEIMSCVWAGFSTSEVVWADDEELGWVPKKIVTLPPGTILLETERTGELTKDGILQYQRNYNPYLLGRGLGFFGGLISTGIGLAVGNGGQPDPLAKYGDQPFPLRTANTFNYLSVRIATAKCVHVAFNAQGKFGNPYGRSLLRRVYKWYVLKDSLTRMMATALDRKGTPLTLVFADSNTTLENPEENSSGENPRQVRQKGIRADKAALDAFKNVHNDSVIVLPGKEGEIFKAQTLNQTSNVDDFLNAIRFCNQSIMRGIMVPALLMNGGDGSGSYALGQEHAQTFDKICDSMNGVITSAIIEQLIAKAIRLNFPESVWKKDGFGSFGRRELTADEIDKEMATIERAVNVGAVDMNDLNDLNAVREKIKFEPRTKIIEPPVTPFGDEEGNDEFAPPGTMAEDKTEGGTKAKNRNQ